MNNIERAKLQISTASNIDNIDKFNKIYPFTTENIKGYIDELEIKDKKMLTVGSSCDQALNAIYKGCKDITILDICPYIKEYYYLKSSALEILSYEEFLAFLRYRKAGLFGFDNIRTFSYNKFYKIKDLLKEKDYESYCFWEELYKNNLEQIIREKLFSINEKNKRCIKECNPYLKTKKDYKKLQQIISEIEPTFIVNDILKTNLKEQYDVINLSNLITYLKDYEVIYLLQYMKKHLKKDGHLLVTYLYNFNFSNPEYVHNLENILDDYLKLHIVDGIEELEAFDYNHEVDGVLIYKKTK